MLQDIAPHIYHNPMSFVPPAPGDLALAYAGGPGPGQAGRGIAPAAQGGAVHRRLRLDLPASPLMKPTITCRKARRYRLQAFPWFPITGSRPGANGLCLRRGREPRPVVCRKPVLRRLRQVSGAQHLGTGLGLPRLWPHCLP